MATRVLLSVDTELTWRHFAGGADWRRNLDLSFNACGVGVPWQLGRLAAHGLKACFFVDPMPALVYGIEPIKRMVAPILAAGQEVQLHVHSFWFDVAGGRRDKARFELTEFPADAQRDLIARARDLLTAAGAPPPIAFRSGSFAANADTLDALRSLGFSHDSSHCGAEHPWPSALPFDPALIEPFDCGGLVEVPITHIRRRDGGLRPMQLCALSRAELEAALRHADHNAHSLVTIVSHSFELASRDGKRINRLVRDRFEWLCAHLADRRSAMPTVSFADLPAPRPAAAAKPMPAEPLREIWRIAEQAWGQVRYEQPAIAAGIAAAPSIAAIAAIAAGAD